MIGGVGYYHRRRKRLDLRKWLLIGLTLSALAAAVTPYLLVIYREMTRTQLIFEAAIAAAGNF